MVPEQESALELADIGILQPKIGCERDNDGFFNAHTATLFSLTMSNCYEKMKNAENEVNVQAEELWSGKKSVLIEVGNKLVSLADGLLHLFNKLGHVFFKVYSFTL